VNTTSTHSTVLPLLYALLTNRRTDIQDWFAQTFKDTPPFFYHSVDLRHSGFKLAPVDTNLFPGGFNNLNIQERQHAIPVTKQYFKTYYPHVKHVLILTEDHTRNLYYFENISVLKTLLEAAGIRVTLSSFDTSLHGTPRTFHSLSGIPLMFEPIQKKKKQLETTDGYAPDFIIINNDLTAGIPDLIQHITQPIMPPPDFGWHQRRKTSHFDSYNELARNFCHHFDLDPWLISTIFSRCGIVNFKEQSGIECVALSVEKTLHQIQEKYTQYGIKQEPYVFIKSDRGTYGMGIMTARSGDDILHLNKNTRKRMSAIKGGVLNTAVIIQEGIPTIDTVDKHPAEPMLYLIGDTPVGCIYRANTQKDAYSNLNSAGMQFSSIPYATEGTPLACPLGFVAKLACLAAARECYTDMYQI